jgi:hypothetical protein
MLQRKDLKCDSAKYDAISREPVPLKLHESGPTFFSLDVGKPHRKIKTLLVLHAFLPYFVEHICF